ncbi:MAG: hypothetical protein AAGA47_13100, partial [Pseudomonadota bacterium]
LISRYSGGGSHVDAYAVTTAEPVELSDYVSAFFQTPVFRLERRLLSFGGHASDAGQVLALAEGTGEAMAAWRVEDRSDRELLLTVPGTPIRTWLAVDEAQVWFGSAVLADETGKIAFAARALMPFHAFYSRLLLSLAARALPR